MGSEGPRQQPLVDKGRLRGETSLEPRIAWKGEREMVSDARPTFEREKRGEERWREIGGRSFTG